MSILFTSRNPRPSYITIERVRGKEIEKETLLWRPGSKLPQYSSSSTFLLFVICTLCCNLWFSICLACTNILVGFQWRFSNTFYGVIYSYSSSLYMCDLLLFFFFVYV